MTLKATKEETKTIEAVNCPACGGRAVGRWKQYVPDGWVVVCRRNKCHMSSDVGRIKQKTLYDAIETWNIYVGYLKRGEKLEEAKQEKDGLLPVICPECGDSPLMTGSTETGFKVECNSYSCRYTDGMPGCVMVNTEYEAIEDWNNQARLIKYRERYVCESKEPKPAPKPKLEPLPCPRCGSGAHRWTERHYSSPMIGGVTHTDRFAVSCNETTCPLSNINLFYYATRDEAVKKWNKYVEEYSMPSCHECDYTKFQKTDEPCRRCLADDLRHRFFKPKVEPSPKCHGRCPLCPRCQQGCSLTK